MTDRGPFPRGVFRARIHRGGSVIEEVCEPNLFVDGGREVLAQLLGGQGQPITRFGVGTSGAAPSVGDTGLQNQILTAVVDVSFPAPGQVSFAWQVGGGIANGLSLREFGLFTEAGVLVARKVRAEAIEKAGDVGLDGTWTLEF